MEWIAGGLAVLLAVAGLYIGVQFAFALVRSELRFHWGMDPLRPFLLRKIRPEHKQMLQEWCPYYVQLDREDRLEFEYRLALFIRNRDWNTRNQETLEDETVLRIACAAVQISFGFPALLFEHFRRIVVYPTDYRSRITGFRHQGEVNPSGLLVFSETALEMGYSDSMDGRNLALHEMSHALLIENESDNTETDFLEDHALAEMRLCFEHMRNEIEAGQSLLRPYAATNFMEFVAVSVECFFEQTRSLKQQHPALFKTMVELLKQDPGQRKFLGTTPGMRHSAVRTSFR
ncbi:DgsA anti-repressor MtfA [bacterium]|nr:DgsA anti-repressor MtfA [bacterium]